MPDSLLDRYLAPPAQAGDPLDAQLAEERRQAAILAARRVSDADRASRASRLAQAEGLPASTVERHLPVFIDRERGRQWKSALEAHPAITRWLATPRNAAAGADDSAALAKVAEQYRVFGPRPKPTPFTWREKAGNLWKSLKETTLIGTKGVTEFGNAYADLQEKYDVTVGLQRRLFGGTMYDIFQKKLGEASEAQARAAAAAAPDYSRMGRIERGVTKGIGMVPTSLLALGTAAFGAPGLGLGMLGASTAGNSYREGRDAGLGVLGAAGYGATQGGIEIVTERLPVLKYLADTKAGAGIFKRVTNNLIAEQFGEQIATAGQDFTRWAAIERNQGKTLRDYWDERPDAAIDTALAVVASVGATNTLIEGGRGIAGLVTRAADAREAEREAAFLNGLADIAPDSRTRQRDPEAFAELLRTLDSDATETVYIPADALATYLQSDPNADREFWQVHEPQIAAALASGGDVVLSTADAVARLVGTPAWEALRDDLRLSPGGVSMREAQALADETPEILDRFADEADAADAADLPRAMVFERVYQQLLDAGYTPDAARIQAEVTTARAVTRAQRRGTPLTGREYDDLEIARVLPPGLAPLVAGDQLDVVVAAMRRQRNGGAPSSSSLLEFLAKRGGVEDVGGDIASMGGDRWHREKAFRRRLIRPHADRGQGSMLGAGAVNPNSIEASFRDAVDAGFFPELLGREADDGSGYADKLDLADFLEAIEAELRGTPRFAEQADTDRTREAADELYQLLDEQGIDPATATNRQIKAAIDRYRQEQRGDYSQSPTVADVLTAASAPGHNNLVAPFGKVSAWLVEQAAEHELDLAGFTHVIDTSGVRHVRNNHGNARAEQARGQLGIGDADFLAVQDLLQSPDQVVFGTLNRLGRPQIVYLKSLPDGSTLYLEEVRAGRRQLATQSLRKYPPTMNAASILATLDPNARSDRKDTLKIVQVPAGIKAIEDAPLRQGEENGARGQVSFRDGRTLIQLFEQRDLSTFTHEIAHTWLEELREDALQPDASDGVRQDWETVKSWFALLGHPITEDGSIPVEAHEFWARGVERYVMEGKSPSPALRRVFDALRSWLLTIYRAVQNFNSPISPEVRAVMDRLVATDEEIAAASEEQRLRGLFDSADTAGMTDDEFTTYRASLETARSEAFDALLYRTMASVRATRTAEYRDQRRTVRTEVTEAVAERPVWRAMAMLSGRDQSARLDRDWLVREYGADVLDLLPKSVPPIYVEQGADPDALSDVTGFRTGRELVEMLLGVEERRRALRAGGDKRSIRDSVIDEETDAIMADRFGDPLNDGTIEREARELIHNDRQGDVIAAELRALGRKRRGASDPNAAAPTPYALAKRWAAERVATGAVRDVASRAAIDRYRRAARKAASEAERAILAGNVDEAFRQKQRQLLNNALISAASKAADEIEAAVGRMSKLAKRRTAKTIDQDYLEQAHALLEAVDLRARSQVSIDRQGSFEKWARAREAEGFDIVVPASFEATLGQTHWSRLSVENLLGLDESVAQIVHLGRLKRTLLDAAEHREFDAVVSEAVDAAERLPQRPPSDLMSGDWRERISQGVARADAALLKMETVFDWLDGGNSDGVFNRIAFRPIAEAQGRENAMVRDYIGRLSEAMAKVGRKQLSTWGTRVSINELINRRTGSPFVLTKGELISVALNMGNEGNKQRLLDGYRWTEEGVRAALDRTLTATEWAYVQDVWDIIDGLWPEISALERRVNGVAPEKVEAVPVTTPFGQLRGGYYPAVYDTARDYRSEELAAKTADLFEANYTRATTRSSASKDRLEKVERPLKLDLSVINSHVVEVVHDITHREAVMQAARFLADPRVMKAVDDSLGPAIRGLFKPWLKHVANQWATERAGNEGIVRFIKNTRVNATIVGMGFRASTIITQIAGYSNSFETVGERWVAPEIGRFYAQLASWPVRGTPPMLSFALERSTELRDRFDTLDRDIQSGIRQMAGREDPLSKAKRFAFYGIGFMDRGVSVPTWMGAYNRALHEGRDEAGAIYAADKAVRQSQGAGAAKDLAAIQTGAGTGGELLKYLTMFYSYFSAQYQRQRTLGRDVADASRRRDYRMGPRLLARATWLLLVAAILPDLLVGRGPGDDEDWGEWVSLRMLFGALGTVPVVRDLVRPAMDKLLEKPSFGYQLSPIQRVGETFVNVWGDVGELARGEETSRATRNALELVGYATGLVPGQIATATQFLVDVGYGEQDPDTTAEWYRGLTTGKAQPREQ